MNKYEEIKKNLDNLHNKAERYQEEQPRNYFKPQQPPYSNQERIPQPNSYPTQRGQEPTPVNFYQQPNFPQQEFIQQPAVVKKEPSVMEALQMIYKSQKKLDKGMKVIAVAISLNLLILLANIGGNL